MIEPFPLPKTIIEQIAVYQSVIDHCHLEIQRLIAREKLLANGPDGKEGVPGIVEGEEPAGLVGEGG